MQMAIDVRDRIVRNALLSVFLYALPVLLMMGAFAWSGQRPWLEENGPKGLNQWATQNLKIFTTYGWPLFMVVLGVIEFSLGLYEKRWNTNERRRLTSRQA